MIAPAQSSWKRAASKLIPRKILPPLSKLDKGPCGRNWLCPPCPHGTWRGSGPTDSCSRRQVRSAGEASLSARLGALQTFATSDPEPSLLNVKEFPLTLKS